MVKVLAVADKLAVLLVTTGITLATRTAVPLLMEFVKTVAVRSPTEVGLVVKVTVSEESEAAVTVPMAPRSNVTVLLPSVVSKPNPLITIVVAFAAKVAELLVTTGMTVATEVAAPLETPLVVTTTVKSLADVGGVVKVTVSEVAVAAATVPAAPLLNTTELFPGVVSKPDPLIVILVASAARSVVSAVTTGITVATCTADPLLTLFVVTIAVKLPAAVGSVERDIVKDVAVAEVIVPSAPLLNTTELLAALVSKPNPLITRLVASAAIFKAALDKTTGFTSAI